MATAKFAVTNFTIDDPATIKAKLDANMVVLERVGAAFSCYANSTPDMAVKVASGGMLVVGSLVEQGVQSSATITAPGGGQQRYDRVVIDAVTGVAALVTGTPSGVSPVPPAIPQGKLPVARIGPILSTTTMITNALITDERALLHTDLISTARDAKTLRQVAGVTGNAHAVKTADYTVLASDCGKVLRWTGSTPRTASFSPCADLGEGFTVEISNGMTVTLTLDPSGLEAIDGASTLVLLAGESCQLRCNGTELLVVGGVSKKPVDTMPGAASFTGDISPSALTANQNDWNPTGLSGSSVLRADATAARTITGLQGGVDGRLIFLHNISAYTLTLAHESASSSAANRFDFGANLDLQSKSGVILQYDSTSNRWRKLDVTRTVTGFVSTDANLGVGSFALLMQPGGLVLAGAVLTGASLSYASTVDSETNPSGTWRLHGRCPSGAASVWQRIA